MATHWRELLELAQEIAASIEGEPARRAAAGRAYYAAFHCANEHLGSGEYIGHRIVMERLLGSQSKRDIAAGRMLGQAMRRRVHADYHLSKPFGDKEMLACIEDARRVVKMLGS